MFREKDYYSLRLNILVDKDLQHDIERELKINIGGLHENPTVLDNNQLKLAIVKNFARTKNPTKIYIAYKLFEYIYKDPKVAYINMIFTMLYISTDKVLKEYAEIVATIKLLQLKYTGNKRSEEF